MEASELTKSKLVAYARGDGRPKTGDRSSVGRRAVGIADCQLPTVNCELATAYC